MIRFSVFKCGLLLLIHSYVGYSQEQVKIEVEDAKNTPLERPAPPKDPELASYYINSETSLRAANAEAVVTSLPLRLEKGARICFVGNLLLDAERRYGHLETLIQQHHPEHELTVRNLAWPADEVDLMPRPDNFGDLDQHLTYFKASVIIAAFGYNESFAGEAGLAAFRGSLEHFLGNLRSKAYDGEKAAQIVLLSPTHNLAHSKVPLDPEIRENQERYAMVMKEVAAKMGVAFVDVLDLGLSSEGGQVEKLGGGDALTVDGHAFNEKGHALFSDAVFRGMFEEKAPAIRESLRELVVDKGTQFFQRYRPLNTFYYTGGRNESYGYLDFLPAMRNFDLMVENRDRAIHTSLRTGKVVKPDDTNLPELDEVLLARGANEFLSPEDELAAFEVDPRFEVNCFASEEDFPEMACPIAMRWDERGRLWVSTSVTYPHVYPGQKAADKIIILEDTDGDGKADHCLTWADDLHIPLSFVLDGSGGVYCSEQPHLTHLTDRDGDGKMDHREIVYTGFGCEDSHHSLHDFTWTPSGDLLFREAIFHHSQVETAYGPVRVRNSSWFLFKPESRKLVTFGSYPNTNPWGVTFDQWGNHVASHPVFASTFHATNPRYSREAELGTGYKQEEGQHPHARGMQAYSGTCGQDFVTHEFWPEEMQGGFIKARYKPTNRIEFHRWIEKEDHFAEEYQFDLIFSKNLSFIPVDVNFGPEGACYVCDWYNPVKGHAQYSLRDPRRDRKAGRIWRIIPKGVSLAKPPKIAEASVAELSEHLKSPHYRTRYRAKLELRARLREDDGAEFLGVGSKEGLHLLEELWVWSSLGKVDFDQLEGLIKGDDHLVAAAAFGVLRFAEVPAEKLIDLLAYGAGHKSQHVRRETALCASYVLASESHPGPAAVVISDEQRSSLMKAISTLFDQASGVHLSYAIRTAFMSDCLKPYWPSGTAGKLAELNEKIPKVVEKLSKEEKKFDRQKGVQVVKVGAIPERLLFTKNQFSVKAGKPVKLVFSNPDATEHNLLILAKGASVEEVGLAANEMAKSPEGAKKHYVPEDERIIHATKLIKTGRKQTLRFVAPTEPGDYPYVCTFPGHWTIMRGVMKVE